MYAHLNIWQLNEAGASSDDTAARELANQLRQQPGFHSYTVIRTGQREVAAITIFDSPAQLDRALETLADFVRQRIAPLAAGSPERRRGDVLYHAAA